MCLCVQGMCVCLWYVYVEGVRVCLSQLIDLFVSLVIFVFAAAFLVVVVVVV